MDLLCRMCEGKRSYDCPKQLQKHYQSKHSKIGMKFRCNVCFNFFSNETLLRGHMFEDHSDEEPYRCDYCDQGFVDLEGIWSHTKSKHRDMKKICGLCGNGYDSAGQHTIECNKKK